MALQVEQRLPGDVAERLDLVWANPDTALTEASDVVELAFGVDLRPPLPQALIRAQGALEVGAIHLLVAQAPPPGTDRRRRDPLRVSLPERAPPPPAP